MIGCGQSCKCWKVDYMTDVEIRDVLRPGGLDC